MKKIALELESSAADARKLARAVWYLADASSATDFSVTIDGFRMNKSDKGWQGLYRINIKKI